MARVYKKNRTLTQNLQQPAQEPNPLSITQNLESQPARSQTSEGQIAISRDDPGS